MSRYVARWVPGHTWVQIALSRNIEPGHHWQYGEIVRRDTFSVRGWGVVVLRMQSQERLAARLGLDLAKKRRAETSIVARRGGSR